MSAQSADDLTNKQLLSAMTDMFGVISENMATKRDLLELREEMRTEFATKVDFESKLSDGLNGLRAEIKSDMDQLETRLSRKIDSNRTTNVKHHLETRRMIGQLNKQYEHLREGLAIAATPISQPQ